MLKKNGINSFDASWGLLLLLATVNNEMLLKGLEEHHDFSITSGDLQEAARRFRYENTSPLEKLREDGWSDEQIKLMLDYRRKEL